MGKCGLTAAPMVGPVAGNAVNLVGRFTAHPGAGAEFAGAATRSECGVFTQLTP